MNYFEYFSNDTARTFPDPTDIHKNKIITGMMTDDNEAGVITDNIKQMLLSGASADVIKSFIFYNKLKDIHDVIDKNCEGLPSDCVWSVGNKSVHAVHGLLGVASEVPELARAIILGMSSDENYDVTNIKEELGDIVVYCSLIARTFGFTIEDVMKANVAKRAKRFPDGFTEYNAVNRNLDAEREVLEERH